MPDDMDHLRPALLCTDSTPLAILLLLELCRRNLSIDPPKDLARLCYEYQWMFLCRVVAVHAACISSKRPDWQNRRSGKPRQHAT